MTASESILLAAYAALLHRYSGGHDITFGYEGLPLRIAVDGGASFTDLVRRVTDVREEALAPPGRTHHAGRLVAPGAHPGRRTAVQHGVQHGDR